jgi:hypothetical protein
VARGGWLAPARADRYRRSAAPLTRGAAACDSMPSLFPVQMR